MDEHSGLRKQALPQSELASRIRRRVKEVWQCEKEHHEAWEHSQRHEKHDGAPIKATCVIPKAEQGGLCDEGIERKQYCRLFRQHAPHSAKH